MSQTPPVTGSPFKRKLVLKRRVEPVEEEAPKKLGAPPKKPITDLEKTILKQSGGKIEVMEVPDKPLPDQELFEFQAQQMTAVENLMFKGIRTPHLIAQALSITEHVAAKYVKAVLARWSTLGSEVDIKTQRGEALGYMDFLQNQLWTQYMSAKNFVDLEMKKKKEERDLRGMSSSRQLMLQLNNQIISLNQQRNQIYGLTPQAIQQMLVLGGGGEDYEVLTRMKKQQGIKELLMKMGNILAEKRRQANMNAIDA